MQVRPGVLTTHLPKPDGVPVALFPELPALTPQVKCIAPVQIDGGTRFALDVPPETFEEISPIREHACFAFRRVVRELRQPTTRGQEKQWRAEGGRVCMLPRSQQGFEGFGGGSDIAAEVKVSGSRRESLTFYVPDVVHIRMNVETGQVRLQLKAKPLWASGYAFVAGYWLPLVSWWVTGNQCSLRTAYEEGWRTTGLEVCSDFTGLDFRDEDARAFVGFRTDELVRKFTKDGKLQTINLGTRGSPISMCLYDKDAQLAEVKGGDDSAYRAVHKKHGWNGEAERRRVEFRLTGRGLQFKDDREEEIDLRDPAALANERVMRKVWAVLCWKKRLVLEGSATRRERMKTDPRWEAVVSASGMKFEKGYRQTREAQKDAHIEAVRRGRRGLLREAYRIKALHDIPDEVPLPEALRFVWEISPPEERSAMATYGKNYRALREPFMGEEIRTQGRADWDRWRSRQQEPEAAA